MSDAWDGRPQNPERDGWHWVDDAAEGVHPHYWYADPPFWRGIRYRPHEYLGPCLTPTEVAAERAAQWCAGRDAAAEAIKARVGAWMHSPPASEDRAHRYVWQASRIEPPAADARALAALLAQARREGLEEAAAITERLVRQELVSGDDIAAAIRAAAAEDAA